MTNKLSKQKIAIAYTQQLLRRVSAYQYIRDNKWMLDYRFSSYKSPVTYLRYRHGITWKDYYPAWGGIMYTSYGIYPHK